MDIKHIYALILVALMSLCIVAECIGDEARDYAFAYNLFQEKAYKMAREQFEKFIQSYPESDKADDARLFVGYCSYYLGEYTKAVEEYKRLLNDYPARDSRFLVSARQIRRGHKSL
jgi:TolA-binding protein